MKRSALLIPVLCLLAGTGCSRRIHAPQERTVERRDTLILTRTAVRTDTVVAERTRLVWGYDSVAPRTDTTGRVTGYDRWHYRFAASADGSRAVSRSAVSDSTRSATELKTAVREAPAVRGRSIPGFLRALGIFLCGAAAGAAVRLRRRKNRPY